MKVPAARLWVWAVALLAAAGVAALVGLALDRDAGAEAAVPLVTEAERLREDGRWERVALPDELQAPPAASAGFDAQARQPVRARYRVALDLQGATQARALYFPGLLGHLRLRINDQLLIDDVGEVTDAQALPPRPRGRAALRLVELPPLLLQPGANRLEFELLGRAYASVSVFYVGEQRALGALRERKTLWLVTGPVIVATVIGCLGLAMLLLWARLGREAAVGYFGLGAVLWAVHTLWTVAPRSLLSGAWLAVAWNSLYAALVTMLVLFALRFVQWPRPGLERALLLALAATPPLLWASDRLGLLVPATEGLRLLLVLMAFSALALVARHAWYRRSLAAAFFVAAGLASAAFGLRDWLVFRYGADNYPVPLTPYAGLPFIVLVSWLLIDRFVRNAERFESVNAHLEQRVAHREAELADNFQRMAALERQQVANEERARILRELHDGLGARLLTSLNRVRGGALDARGLAEELQAGLTDMRLASEALTPDRADLADAVGNLLFRWQTLLREAGVRAQWQIELPEEGLPLPPHTVLQILRVMQEALSNALRHAHAASLRLRLACVEGALNLEIEDDGVGLGAAVTRSAQPGRGLQDMATRAAGIGASFEVDTPPGGGTRLALRLPLPAAG